MVGKINALLDLTPAERRLAYQACYWLIRVHRRLDRQPFQRVLQQVRRWASGRKRAQQTNGTDREAEQLRVLCGWIERCARNLPGNYSCLPQALAGYILCSRHGHAPELRVGVVRSPGADLQAHAWLEFDNTVILGDLPDLQSYRVFQDADRLVR